jgi:hypothetical protein
MNIIHVHFRIDDGGIDGWENSPNPQAREGCDFISIEVLPGHHVMPDPLLHRVDLTTLELVDKTPEERAIAAMPTAAEVRQAIARELRATDQYMAPDRPLSDTARAIWATYRQALRDLSKLRGLPEMLAFWPVRPDGIDVAARMRARIVKVV